MRHREATDEIRERASLHALGMLDPGEARAFEQHIEKGCEVCASERRAFEATASWLPLAVSDAEPDAALRQRLLDRLGPPPAPIPDFLHIVRASQGEWQPTGFEGVTFKPLYLDAAQEAMTMLVRMAPGVSYPGHHHAGPEQCLVLEGDLRTGDVLLHAGDYQCAAADSTHAVSTTVNGCLLLIIASTHNQTVV